MDQPINKCKYTKTSIDVPRSEISDNQQAAGTAISADEDQSVTSALDGGSGSTSVHETATAKIWGLKVERLQSERDKVRKAEEDFCVMRNTFKILQY